MNIFLLFGSKSDAYIYEPLKTSLINSGHNVNFRFLSVHRSPELMDKELEYLNADIVVAGAGLSAHLPGVLSSKILLPVIGVPCAPALGGLDALLSMIQMPFGIPVLTTAPDQYQIAIQFIQEWSGVDLRYSEQPVHIIVERNKLQVAYVDALLSKTKNIAEKAGLELSVRHELVTEAVNILLVEVDCKDPEAPLPFPQARGEAREIRVHVPLFKENSYKDPLSALHLLQKMKSCGGLWVGANNIGNGYLAGLQLANSKGNYNAILTNAKKGYIHLYG